MKKKLDKSEKEILDSFEKGEWKSAKKLEEKKEIYSNIASNTFLKNKRINIRLSEKDIAELKAKSLEEGIPYQTLIASVLHKYVNGRLIENSN